MENLKYNKKKGIMCIISAAAFFALMNLFIRLSGDIPTVQKAFFRNIVALMIATTAIIKNKQSFVPQKGNIRYLLLRSVCGTIGILGNFYAIDHLNISDASILNKLSPFFSIIFSVMILNERADKTEWAIVLTAFFGALFVVKPGFSSDSFPALIGMLSGLSAGIAYTFVRKLGGRGENSALIVFFFSAFSCICLLPQLFLAFAPMTLKQTVFLILTGFAAAGGQFSITAAYTYAPAKEISVFDYFQVIFAALLGFAFLGQIPDVFSFIGYAIILAAAVFRWKYDPIKKNG